MTPLVIAVLASAVWAVLALAAQAARLAHHGRRSYHAPRTRDPRRAVGYAFSAGMSPMAKESVRTHVPLYLVGICFHLGLAAGLLRLAFDLARVDAGPPARALLGALCLLGGCAGLTLLLRRTLTPALRSFSTPDDFVANLCCLAFLFLGGAAAFAPSAASAAQVAAAALFLYAPIGKIRHCVFFFPARYHSAVFFGRRGAYPPTA